MYLEENWLGLVISTPWGKEVEINECYEGCIILLKGYELRVDLVPLDMVKFVIILGMDWLSLYRATVDCYAKLVILIMPNGDEIEFKRERNGVCNGLISMLIARKFMYELFLFIRYIRWMDELCNVLSYDDRSESRMVGLCNDGGLGNYKLVNNLVRSKCK